MVLPVEADITPLVVVEFDSDLLLLVNELVATLNVSAVVLPFRWLPSTELWWLPEDFDKVNLRFL